MFNISALSISFWAMVPSSHLKSPTLNVYLEFTPSIFIEGFWVLFGLFGHVFLILSLFAFLQSHFTWYTVLHTKVCHSLCRTISLLCMPVVSYWSSVWLGHSFILVMACLYSFCQMTWVCAVCIFPWRFFQLHSSCLQQHLYLKLHLRLSRPWSSHHSCLFPIWICVFHSSLHDKSSWN